MGPRELVAVRGDPLDAEGADRPLARVVPSAALGWPPSAPDPRHGSPGPRPLPLQEAGGSVGRLSVVPVKSDGSRFSPADVLEVVEHILPDYRSRLIRWEGAALIARALNVEPMLLDLECPGFALPEILGVRRACVSSQLDPSARTFVLLHELVHIMAHSPIGERTRGEEAESDLVAGVGITSDCERRLPTSALHDLLAHWVPLLTTDREWPGRLLHLSSTLSAEA